MGNYNNKSWNNSRNDNYNRNKNQKDTVNLNDSSKVNVEKVVEKTRITTTQLRLLLSNAVVVKNKIELEQIAKGDEIKTFSKEIENDIKYLLIKHIYQCGRDNKVKEFDNEFHISGNIKAIGNSKEKFNEFFRYLEEIVAYVKYYRG